MFYSWFLHLILLCAGKIKSCSGLYFRKSNRIITEFTKQKLDYQSTLLASQTDEYNAVTLSKAEFIFHRTRQKYYFESECPCHLLVLMLKQGHPSQ